MSSQSGTRRAEHRILPIPVSFYLYFLQSWHGCEVQEEVHGKDKEAIFLLWMRLNWLVNKINISFIRHSLQSPRGFFTKCYCSCILKRERQSGFFFWMCSVSRQSGVLLWGERRYCVCVYTHWSPAVPNRIVAGPPPCQTKTTSLPGGTGAAAALAAACSRGGPTKLCGSVTH